jgi:hypothetical protein
MKPFYRMILLAVAGLSLVLAACGGESALEPDEPESTAAVVEPESAEVDESKVADIATLDTPTAVCPGDEIHPIGASLAEKYALPYDQVMGWFCAGSLFEDIALALQTGELVEVAVEDLLAQRKLGQSWDDIWKGLGLIK